MANQFVVELKNEPGALAVLAESLAAAGSTCGRSAAAGSVAPATSS